MLDLHTCTRLYHVAAYLHSLGNCLVTIAFQMGAILSNGGLAGSCVRACSSRLDELKDAFLTIRYLLDGRPCLIIIVSRALSPGQIADFGTLPAFALTLLLQI